MKIKSEAGSVLIMTLSFLILLSAGAAAILQLTSSSYRLSTRNELRAQARAVADSEMEYLYYQFMSQILLATPPTSVPSALAAANLVDNASSPTTLRTPFLAVYQAAGWQVKRSAYYNSPLDQFFGQVPGTTKQGTTTSITVEVEVALPSSSVFANSVDVRVGRRFQTSNTPIFQYGVFYQGNLELAPGKPMTIAGDVSANGSVFLGSTANGPLTLTQAVRYLANSNPPGVFNQDANGNTTYRMPNTPVTSTLYPPIFSTSQASQVQPLTQPENLQGGVDAQALSSTLRPDLFPTVNDVYRSLIVPPPGVNPNETPSTYNSALGDDPTIGAQRIYNRAGLLITVNTNNTVTVQQVDPTTQTMTNVTATYAPAITGVGTTVHDMREGKDVAMTTINVGTLTTILAANNPNFNGVLYVNLMGSNSTTPGGLRLTNATTTPQTVYNTGFSVATNGGLYIQGDYNTTPRADGSINPAMVMGDAVTLLTNAWVDANSSASMFVNGDPSVPSGLRVGTANLTNGVNQITLNTGILTGNTPATTTNVSGGAQNLVRYLEDMGTNTINVLMHGSVGQLFQSKVFNSPFQQPSMPADVYMSPAKRDIQFNSALLSQPPAGSPSTTSFSRGNFFLW
jgi:hypothetical protein